MPYITFSRKFADRSLAKRFVRSGAAKGSLATLRGSRTIERVAQDALAHGFGSVLIISRLDPAAGRAVASELSVRHAARGVEWRYGRTKQMSIAMRPTHA